MKIFKGLRHQVGQVIVTVEEHGPTTTSYSLRHVERHSPDGFEWGYGGSGPADLARSILVDLFGVTIADAYYQNFKWAFIAPLREAFFEIREEDVKEWIKEGAMETRKIHVKKIWCVPRYGYVGRDMVVAETAEEAARLADNRVGTFEPSEDAPTASEEEACVEDVYEFGDGGYDPEDVEAYLSDQEKRVAEDAARGGGGANTTKG